jgi:hypothetical protein
VQLLKNVLKCYGIRRSTALFIRALHWSLFWAILMQVKPLQSEIYFNIIYPISFWFFPSDKLEVHGFHSRWINWNFFFNLLNPSNWTMVLGSNQLPTEMSTRSLPGAKRRPARMADKLSVICEPTVQKKWDPRRLTILRASMADYRDSWFTFYFIFPISYPDSCNMIFPSHHSN